MNRSGRLCPELLELESRTPSALLASFVDTWRRDLTSEKFSAECPLVAAAADTAATSDQLRQVLRRAFDGWLEPLSESLADLGVPLESSGNLAVVIAALEGAIILARSGATLPRLTRSSSSLDLCSMPLPVRPGDTVTRPVRAGGLGRREG